MTPQPDAPSERPDYTSSHNRAAAGHDPSSWEGSSPPRSQTSGYVAVRADAVRDAYAQINALKAENQALTEACQALRDAYGVLKEAAQAVWDAKSQSGDAIAAWTRLIDVLEGSAER